MARKGSRGGRARRQVGYAVVGLGHIAQSEVLPAFEHAHTNSRLVAVVSSSPEKERRIAKDYGASRCCGYGDFDQCVQDPDIDAVYIATPNTEHLDFATRAARAGVHVLCEKPMATTERDCRAMIQAADDGEVKLMIAYRLHFEESNMRAAALVAQGKLGEPRIFESVFSYQVQPGNVRLRSKLGGGPTWDIGIYCVNAARYLFRQEPTSVFASRIDGRGDERFKEVEEGMAVILRFPDEKVASFVCSYGAAPRSTYRVVGTEATLTVENAYEYAGERRHVLEREGKKSVRTFPEVDQFAPELLYFSDCILEDRDPEPDGEEGLADVRILRAIYRSARQGKPVDIAPIPRRKRPSVALTREIAPAQPRELVDVEAPAQ